jgi:imidazolonepropionase-like amidohydrolase
MAVDAAGANHIFDTLIQREGRFMFDLVVNNARIFDGEKLLDGLQSVGIANGRISFLSPRPSAAPARKEIDAAGRFLMPGLIDCHLHLLNMWTALDAASMAADINGELKTRLRALLDAGVTTVKSVGDSEDDILRVRDMLAAGEVVGPTLYATGAAFAAPGSHPATTVFGKNPWMRNRATFETDSPQQARDAVRRKAEHRVDAIKIVHQGGCKHGDPYFFRVPALGIDVQILRLDHVVLEAIIDESHKQGLKATVHTVDEHTAVEALEAGADGLEHGVMDEPLTNDRIIELLLRNHASYVPTLWLIAFDEKTAATRYANLKRIVEAGVRTPMGTDTFCGFGKFGEIAHIEIEHYARAGIPPLRILKMATSEAAQHLGANDLGTIAPGKLADMIIVDGDPVTNIAALRNIPTVIKNGEVISA